MKAREYLRIHRYMLHSQTARRRGDSLEASAWLWLAKEALFWIVRDPHDQSPPMVNELATMYAQERKLGTDPQGTIAVRTLAASLSCLDIGNLRVDLPILATKDRWPSAHDALDKLLLDNAFAAAALGRDDGTQRQH